jgi:hypothetical protein
LRWEDTSSAEGVTNETSFNSQAHIVYSAGEREEIWPSIIVIIITLFFFSLIRVIRVSFQSSSSNAGGDIHETSQ